MDGQSRHLPTQLYIASYAPDCIVEIYEWTDGWFLYFDDTLILRLGNRYAGKMSFANAAHWVKFVQNDVGIWILV